MSSIYEFIDGEKANYPLVRMFVWAGVSSSGFYEWRGRPASATAERRVWLGKQVAKAFAAAKGRYGYRRVHAVLARKGIAAGPELVRDLMRAQGLVACQPRPFRPATTTPHAHAGLPADLVGRDFTAAAPGVKLVGDITYIPTWQGWLYLAVVIDCHTKQVAGWSMATHMRAELVADAFAMAAGNLGVAPGCVFHSDRGSQYTSSHYRDTLKRFGAVASTGRTGVCWDNAMAESFFAALKNEMVNRTVYATRRQARRAIVEFIEVWYNRQRLHSGLGYRTPQEAHDEYLNLQVAA